MGESQHEILNELLEEVLEHLDHENEIRKGDDPEFAARAWEVVSKLRLISTKVCFVELTIDAEEDEVDTSPFDEVAKQYDGALCNSLLIGEGYIFTDPTQVPECMKALTEKAEELKLVVLVERMTLDELLLADIDLN
ncbi:MAG: hypothetical protein CMJ81_20155 [Planctomycetaceae bacterium]|jgi:hypothetical protein|nr:hypothetical protein [Planctomycetaceae bacterium]MBP62603.1 hypothetical protein [Planctomycetaceae bacterium]